MNAIATAAVLAFSLLIGAHGKSPAEKLQIAHNSSKHTAQLTIIGGAYCSATAIGPHALLTASHCEQPTDDLAIEGSDKVATIVGKIRDGQDHTIYLLSGVTFDSYVNVDTNHKLSQGEHVYMFGNPGEISDAYREGYYAAHHGADNLFCLPAWHGDSGAAVFDENGDIVQVITGMEPASDDPEALQFTFTYDLKFKQSDLDKAQLF
jgi:hypothetical protein